MNAMRRLTLLTAAAGAISVGAHAQQFDVMEATIPSVHAALGARA